MPHSIIYIHKTDISGPDTSLTFVVYNALSLAEEGHDVHLVLVNRSSQDGSRILRDRFDLVSLPPTFHLVEYRLKWRFHGPFYRFATKFVDQLDRGSMVVTRTHKMLPHLLKNKRHDCRYFFETHNYFFDLTVRPDVTKRKVKHKSRIEQRYFNHLDGLICLNQQQADCFLKNGPGIRIDVFPSGLHRVMESNERVDRIVYIGSFERITISFLTELILRLDPAIEMYIVGGKDMKEVKKLEKELPDGQLPQNVTLTGWIDKKELFDILKSARIGLLPLKDTFFNRYLTDPLKLFDYLACGVPVLCNDFPAINKYVEDGKEGYYVDWSDPDGVITTIHSLMKSQRKWDEMSQNVYHKATNYTWQKRAEKLTRYLDQFSTSS